MLFVVIVFALLLIMGVPIALVLCGAGLTHIVALGDVTYFNVAVQRLFTGVNSFSMMAIPFFVLAGEIMNRGRITDKLVDFARALIGQVRGGLAYTVIIVSVLLSAILGSANAVCAILCAILVPEMVKDHYSPEFSTSLIASSAIIGPIIPPSVTFVLYAVLAGTSVNALFLGGIIPGLLLAVAYGVIVYMTGKKEHFQKNTDKFVLMDVLITFVKAIPALLIPVVIAGGILTGLCTPTESGAIAVVIAIISGMFIYRTLSFKDLIKSLIHASVLNAAIMLVVAMGNIFGWTLAMDRIPQKMSALILGISQNRYIVLLIILVMLLLIGMFMEAFAAMIIFVPVFAPIAESVGVDPVHFGMIFSLMVSVALITPPVGMCLFVSSNITKVPLAKLSKSIVPFVVAAMIVVLLVTFFEPLSTWLPNLLMK